MRSLCAGPADLLQRLQVLALDRDQREPKKRQVTGLARTSLFLFRADSADALDGKRRAAGSRGDLAVLFEDVAVCGLVTMQPAEQFRGHAPVGTLRPILIDDVEKGELAFGIGSRFFRHGRLVCDMRAAVKEKDRRRVERERRRRPQ